MTQQSSLKKIVPLPETERKTTTLFIAGIGAIGGALLQQIYDYSSDTLKVIGACNSKRTLWFSETVEPVDISRVLSQNGVEKNWSTIIQKIMPKNNEQVVFVDATGDAEVADLYLELFRNGIHVVTPSKIANSRSQSHFNSLKETAGDYDVQFGYETNVGAGLPVIEPLRNLMATGDEIVEVSGVLSGTMTYLFSQLDSGKTFSESVIKARQLGYAEPDPRDDLSGEDVARKMLILARTCGISIERDDFVAESITPKTLINSDPVTFFEKLSDFDDQWSQRLLKLKKQDKTLRYVGTLNKKGIRVGLQEVDKSTPLGSLTGTNNLIQIKTRRYFDQPLIIQGPGAGKEVTAAGVLADLLKISNANKNDGK